MTLIKIADAPKPCLNPEHNPPSMIVLSPGTYQHTCPGCGYSVQFTVGNVTCYGGSVGTIGTANIPHNNTAQHQVHISLTEESRYVCN